MKRKARQRIEEAADRMACELLKMATDDNVADSVKLAAIRDALDRAGLAAKNAVEVEVGPPKPYEQIFDRIMVLEGGSREAFRRSRGIPDSSDASPTHRARPQSLVSGDDQGCHNQRQRRHTQVGDTVLRIAKPPFWCTPARNLPR